MTKDEQRLFKLIDSARIGNGCAPLRRDKRLSEGAGLEAAARAASGRLFVTEPSKATTGGDNLTVTSAFDQLMAKSSATLLDCDLVELGVGHGQATYCATRILICLRPKIRRAWVADFGG